MESREQIQTQIEDSFNKLIISLDDEDFQNERLAQMGEYFVPENAEEVQHADAALKFMSCIRCKKVPLA